jgi:protein-disulfide isomerase
MPKETPKNKVRSASQKRRQQEKRKNIITFSVIGLVVVAIAVFALTRPHADPLSEARMAADPAYGSESARVTIIEYSDYGCPSCQAWHNSGILQKIRDTYGDKVRFVWKDFPVITSASPKAAEAAQCAFDQGKFWEYHDLLYAKSPAIGTNDLKAYASQVELDTTKFNNCLDSGQNAAKVDQSMNEGYRLGFNGAPSFVVNGQKLIGPPSFETLQSIIDPVLASGS